jgi:hypothetical protein
MWCLLSYHQPIHLKQFDEAIFDESGGPVVAFAAAVRVAFKKWESRGGKRHTS